MKALVLAVFAGFANLAAGPAQAYQAGEMCSLKPTSDGFVALRKGPSVKAKRIRKLYYGDYRVAPIGPIGVWVKVIAGQPEGWAGKGFVKSSLVDWSQCSNAG